MRLSRSMVATLAVLGATCALPALAVSEAATAPPKAGPYIDSKSAVNLRVAKDRKTISSLDASCFVHHVQQGTWELRRLKLSHGMFAFQGPVKVRFESGTKTLRFTIHGKFELGRFRGSVTTTSPSRCAALRFSAKLQTHLDY
jgi:hypothetical protein